jgi:SAM-dependent methyltransferase
MQDIEQLEKIIHQVGPEKIWRPVYTPDNRLLTKGVGWSYDGLPDDLIDFNFTGKSVVDIGCNFGHFTFLIKKHGAAHVTGIDKDALMIQGCNVLKRLFQYDGVSFLAADVINNCDIGKFDVGMLIDVIGKSIIKKGLLKGFLRVLQQVSKKEIILTVKPVYQMSKHFNNDYKNLEKEYSDQYIRNGNFYAIDFIHDRLCVKWQMKSLLPDGKKPYGKETYHFIKKKSAH